MKRWKKLLLVLFVLILLSQLPFVYRRYKLGRLNAAIQSLNSQRHVAADDGAFAEYKGVIHVHSSLGGHSTGTFDEIIAAANRNQLNFVVLTEHTSRNFNTAQMTLKGMHGGVLFINGNEVNTTSSDHLLRIPGDESTMSGDDRSAQEIISQGKVIGSLTFVAYPAEFRSWDATGYDGLEVYNVYTDARKINPLRMFFDALWSYRSYPDLLFANFYSRPSENLAKWDALINEKRQRLVAIAGNDAHANIGLRLNDSSGHSLLGFKLDPYERSFHLVRVHVLVPREKSFDSQSLLSSLASGHCFIAFDLFSSADGFRFTASNSAERRIQGDEISLQNQVRLNVSSPLPGRIVLLKDGNRVQEAEGLNVKDFVVTESGSYRVEVYLSKLTKPVSEQPWIISNPIYVR